LTRKGERPFHPDLGTGIYDFLFEPNINEMLVNIEEEISSATAKWLPYVVITDLRVEVADRQYGFSDNFNGVRISISFTLAGNRFNEESITVVIGAE
jgi:phage baseplate assembly protein W